MTRSRRDLVRLAVRQLLTQCPAWHDLDADRRVAVAGSMVRLGEYLADPGWVYGSGSDDARALQRRMGLAHTLEQGTGADFRQGATAVAPDAFAALTRSIDFPAFIASLVRGVFEAIVEASIEQMKAYQQLIQSLVRSLDEFEKGIPDQDVGSWVQSSWPQSFNMGFSGLEFSNSSSLPSSVYSELGLQSGSALTGSSGIQVIMAAARAKLARQRQRMLATMAMMGIDRIVVTDGRINAKVIFDMSAVDSAAAKSSQSSSQDTTNKTSSSSSGHSFWGTSHSNSQSSSTVRTQVRSASNAASESTLRLNADLSGEVGINFRSETVNLNQLAAEQDVQRIQATARPEPIATAGPNTSPSSSDGASGSAGAGPIISP